MIDEIQQAERAAVARLAAVDAVDDLASIENDLVGKRSELGTLKSRLGGLDEEGRRAAGQALNQATARVTAAIQERRAEVAARARAERIAAERLDLTEVLTRPQRGHLHLVTQTHMHLEDVFVGLGFTVSEGPEVETDWNNFTALNMPPEHPARSMWDTMFVDLGEPGSTVLRTHTSPVQIRVMQSQPPPIYTIMPGRVFRLDTADATHMPVFHQIEGLVIDRGITFGDLSGTIEQFTRAYFGRDFNARLRPSYFPFTEPSAEYDIQRPDGSWLELGGCGVVHPNVLRNCGLDPEEWSGFAFGFGTDRLPLALVTASTTCVRCSRTTSASWSSSDAAAPVMKVLLSWLNELAPVGDDADALAELMNDLGLAVDDVDRVGQPVDGVVVARVLALRPHPDANHVQRVDVDAGDGQPLQVWCGAFNMQVGDLVPLATVGTTMPSGMKIGRRKILGEPSNGMLCSPVEVGFGTEAGGILILPPDLPVGAPLWDAFTIGPDVVFDLDLTRNRPDAYSHAGVARDLAARLTAPLTLPDPPVEVVGPSEGVAVTILDPEGCGRFTARVITGVRIAGSPAWMAERLTRAGMRPINNVVDVSNYVMLELGQPNHTYDLAKLEGGGFIIRKAREGEMVLTLDGVERVCTAREVLICDGNDAPIGIGGIMGGASTEIDEHTTAVALEMAWFDPPTIAASAGRLALRSEASTRFERGADPEGIDRAARRFVELLRLTCPDAALHGEVDARGSLPDRSPVRLRTSRTNALLGTDLSAGEIGVAARVDRVRCRRLAGSRGVARHGADVALRLHSRGGPDRGGRPHPRLLASRQDRAEVSPSRWAHPTAAGSTVGSAGACRCGCLRGDAQPLPRTRRSRTGRPRSPWHHDREPAGERGVGVADVASARTPEGCCVQRVAPQRGRVALRDRARLRRAEPGRGAARRTRDARGHARRARRDRGPSGVG